MPERRQVAIVGVGQTDFGALYANRDAQRDAYTLGAQALRLALDDAGLRKDEVDGLLTARIHYEHGAHVLGIPTEAARWFLHVGLIEPGVWDEFIDDADAIAATAIRSIVLPEPDTGSFDSNTLPGRELALEKYLN